MNRPRRRRLPKKHSAFAEILTAVEAQEYLPLTPTSEGLVYVAVHGYGWDKGPLGPSRVQGRRKPVAIVTWDPRRRVVRGVTGFKYPFYVEYQSLLMVIERPQDLADLVDRLHPFVDARDRRVALA